MVRFLFLVFCCAALGATGIACGSSSSSSSSSGSSDARSDTADGGNTTSDGTGTPDLLADLVGPTDTLTSDIDEADLLPARAPCQRDNQCRPGLKCCYPCGMPGCRNQCMVVGTGDCPAFP